MAMTTAAAATNVAEGTWCSVCTMALGSDKSFLLTSCKHFVCKVCAEKLGPQAEHTCGCCGTTCQTMVIRSDRLDELGPDIQDLISARAAERILDESVRRIASIESFKRHQYKEQAYVIDLRAQQSRKKIAQLGRQVDELQAENKKLRQKLGRSAAR